MEAEIVLPLWVFLLLSALAVLAALDRFLIPSTRWLLRRRINRVLEEIGTRLDIEIRPFQLTKRQVLIDRLAYDPIVVEAARRHAQHHGMPLDVAQNKAFSYAREIVPSFNAYLYFRIGYWAAKKVARLLYRVRVGLLEEDRFSVIDRDSTVVFVMNHRSNMDYVLVAFLAAERTTLSYAVGEWARIWPLQTLIRAMGAFFVRRHSGDNPLYRRVLERYIRMATAEGVCQAVFPEGRLSRDGRLQPPKLGLVDYMLREYNLEQDRDIVFIPVGINYDRTLEDRSLLRELDPEAPSRSRWFVMRTAFRFVRRSLLLMVLSRWERYGYACVNFGAPVSMREYCRRDNVDFRSLTRADRFAEVQRLCEDLMGRISRVIPVLPVSLVAAVYLEAAGRALDLIEIEQRSEQLLLAIKHAGAPVFETPRSTLNHLIGDAVHTLHLRRILLRQGDRYRADPKQMTLLRYYANAMAHWHRASAENAGTAGLTPASRPGPPGSGT
jgi:glycerol-3-phosphate O-acyltransferase